MDKLLLSLTGAVATGALALISPSGWSSRTRHAYVWAPGALVATAAALVLAKGAGAPTPSAPAADDAAPAAAPPAIPPLPLAARVVLPLGLGATTCGFQAGSLWVDGAIERWMIRRGATRPRWWMAGMAALLSLAIDAAGASGTRRVEGREQLGGLGVVPRRDAS